MSFEIGDKVSVLDEDLTGFVKKIVGQTVTIETDEGLDLDFEVYELIKIKSPTNLQKEAFSNLSAYEVAKEKEQPSKKKGRSFKPKKQAQRALEVDLHIDKLVDSTKGMTNFDAPSLV